jgi:hypothetical protein
MAVSQFAGRLFSVVQGMVSGLVRRLAVGVATFGLVAGGMSWVAAQPVITVALASSCNHEDGRCESRAEPTSADQKNTDRTADSQEAKSEKSCRASHTAKFCQDQARAEDKTEKSQDECDEEGNHDGDPDCELYGGSGDSQAHIGALESVTKPIAAAGYDVGQIGTAGASFLVVGTLFVVAVRRRRISRP